MEAARAPLGVPVDHVIVWRDLQKRAAQLPARGPAPRVAMLDETWIPLGGEKRPVAVVTDAKNGALLPLAVSDCDGQAWLKPLAAWGVAVVVTDNASAYGVPLKAHGRDCQPCRVHRRRTFARRLHKLPEAARACYAPRLQRLRVLLWALPAEGAAILMGGLEEAVAPAAAGPKAWRNLVPHFLEHWHPIADPRPCLGRAGHHPPPGRPLRMPEAAGMPGSGLPHADRRAQFPACRHAGLRLTSLRALGGAGPPGLHCARSVPQPTLIATVPSLILPELLAGYVPLLEPLGVGHQVVGLGWK